MTVEIHPLTPDRWQDFDCLFGAHGAYGGYWCMYWRQTRKDFNRLKGQENRALFKELVDNGDMPGLLAYVDGQPDNAALLAAKILGVGDATVREKVLVAQEQQRQRLYEADRV